MNRYMIADKHKKLNSSNNHIKISTLKFKLITIIETLLVINPKCWCVKLQDMYNDFVSELLDTNITCPVCGCNEFSFCGHYTRRVFLLDLFDVSDKYCFMKLKITRITCTNCHKTYSIHPYWMIPYSPFSILDAKYIIYNKCIFIYNHFKKRIPNSLIESTQNRADQWLIKHEIFLNTINKMTNDNFIKYFFNGTHPPFLWKNIHESLRSNRSFNQLFSYTAI